MVIHEASSARESAGSRMPDDVHQDQREYTGQSYPATRQDQQEYTGQSYPGFHEQQEYTGQSCPGFQEQEYTQGRVARLPGAGVTHWAG